MRFLYKLLQHSIENARDAIGRDRRAIVCRHKRVTMRGDRNRPHRGDVGTGLVVRLEFIDAPSHVEDVKRYWARGYQMAGNRFAIVTDHDADLIEVHPPSRGSVDLDGLVVEYYPQVPAMG